MLGVIDGQIVKLPAKGRVRLHRRNRDREHAGSNTVDGGVDFRLNLVGRRDGTAARGAGVNAQRGEASSLAEALLDTGQGSVNLRELNKHPDHHD